MDSVVFKQLFSCIFYGRLSYCHIGNIFKIHLCYVCRVVCDIEYSLRRILRPLISTHQMAFSGQVSSPLHPYKQHGSNSYFVGVSIYSILQFYKPFNLAHLLRKKYFHRLILAFHRTHFHQTKVVLPSHK